MSKVKTPQEKKKDSLNRDRRNNYGENDKASRKSIPRSKQMSHQAERRAAKQPLANVAGEVEEERATNAEQESHAQSIRQKRSGFRKSPDVPLRDVLQHKRTGVWPRSYR
ncbi:MAG TPA: hypothetical protein VJS11_12705 [Acidobacteriaceae bacterium]|nr:hypothetical protein [Acidobacteriaceae bacterium]